MKQLPENKALMIEEKLLFDYQRYDNSGVDFCDFDNDDFDNDDNFLGDYLDLNHKKLTGLSEPQCLRHYVRLSQKNYAIDMGPFPLGSCTMKHNPRLNEQMARLPGFANIHPLAPFCSVQGGLELMQELSNWLLTLTGMKVVAMSPKAGAHGELCGMMVIKAAVAKYAPHKKRILIPSTAHGTNPSTAAQCGFIVDNVKISKDGILHVEQIKEKLADDIAGIMITNPNTCGLFESEMSQISELIHSVGGYVYCDGANFNAIMGKAQPATLGVDAMHLNLHKTFSTPHGGGGPGAGPTVFSERLEKFVPVPFVASKGEQFVLIERSSEKQEYTNRITAFHGQMGMFVRTMTYLLSHGADGLRQVTEDAVLNANYVAAILKEHLHLVFPDRTMHEVLFSDKTLKQINIETMDVAKGLIDKGFHPMTVYFPLVVSGAMLIEPTESESKEELDNFCQAIIDIIKLAKSSDGVQYLHNSPHFAPRKRIDETLAARHPKLSYDDN